HSGRPRGSDVRGDQIRASFIDFASGCTLHNPGTPGYLRAPMAESVAANLAAVQGITVGHWTDLRTWTGCTVVLAPVGGMRAACALRGRATGTREIDALDPRHLVGHIDAVLLTGGSAYGLGAADGVMRWLKERGRGFPVGPAGVVPIVPTAVIFDFDLAPGSKADRWPTGDDAYRACSAASTEIPEGSVGAGTGATVGKALGPGGAMKGGVGTWAVRAGDVVVSALVVLNAVGNVVDANGRILAGARQGGGGVDGKLVDALDYLSRGGAPFGAGAGAGAGGAGGVGAGEVVGSARVVLNAGGNVVDANGRILAGARRGGGGVDGKLGDALDSLPRGGAPFGAGAGAGAGGAGRNTTLAVVAT